MLSRFQFLVLTFAGFIQRQQLWLVGFFRHHGVHGRVGNGAEPHYGHYFFCRYCDSTCTLAHRDAEEEARVSGARLSSFFTEAPVAFCRTADLVLANLVNQGSTRQL